MKNGAQASRYELKYVVDPARALAIRDFVRGYLSPDAYMPDAISDGYAVNSLYLDGNPKVLYLQAREGIKNRYKLRIRFYDRAEHSPAFLEIKHRTTETVRKERAAISKQGVRRILERGEFRPEDLLEQDEVSLRTLNNFRHRCRMLNAQPRVYVSYLRAAYVPRDGNLVRVTFDRKMFGYPYHPEVGLHFCDRDGAPSHQNEVILELKFTDRFPPWMRELTQLFGLDRTSFPKYVECVDAVAVQRRSRRATLRGLTV